MKYYCEGTKYLFQGNEIKLLFRWNAIVFRENAIVFRENAIGISRERNNISSERNIIARERNSISSEHNNIIYMCTYVFHMTLQGLRTYTGAGGYMVLLSQQTSFFSFPKPKTSPFVDFFSCVGKNIFLPHVLMKRSAELEKK